MTPSPPPAGTCAEDNELSGRIAMGVAKRCDWGEDWGIKHTSAKGLTRARCQRMPCLPLSSWKHRVVMPVLLSLFLFFFYLYVWQTFLIGTHAANAFRVFGVTSVIIKMPAVSKGKEDSCPQAGGAH